MKKLFAGALVLCSLTLFAQDKPGAPPAMDAATEAMIKAGTPGEPHKALDTFAGKWDAKVTMWPAPGMDPMVSPGSSEDRWIMGGRILEQRFTSSVMGMTFEGLGYTGYDNVKKQYWSTWMDSMSTGMMLTTGTLNGNVYSYSGSMADPLTGKDSPLDIRITVKDHDHHVMEMWGPAPDGKNFKMMEIAYTRRK
ncbi:MAG TPA: DUF1579 domain-containing protein [Thermoanaerobaculia bacterium]|jgi:hypothetical protein